MSQKFVYTKHYSLMTDFMETSYSGWYNVQNVVRNAETLYVVSFDIKDIESDGKWVHVNVASVQSAILKLITGKIDIRRDIASQFVGKPSGWDYDSIGIDCVMQVICCGDVLYN